MIGTRIGILNMGQICVEMILSPLFGELLDLFHDNYVRAATPVILCAFISVYGSYWLWKKSQSPELPARSIINNFYISRTVSDGIRLYYQILTYHQIFILKFVMTKILGFEPRFLRESSSEHAIEIDFFLNKLSSYVYLHKI